MNSGSASASEIVTAALKQNNRALILGQTTFGKGSVQQIRPFKSGSAIKMTISKYLTPNNTSIQSIGVAPHIELNPLLVSKDLVQIVSNAQNPALALLSSVILKIECENLSSKGNTSFFSASSTASPHSVKSPLKLFAGF